MEINEQTNNSLYKEVPHFLDRNYKIGNHGVHIYKYHILQ